MSFARVEGEVQTHHGPAMQILCGWESCSNAEREVNMGKQNLHLTLWFPLPGCSANKLKDKITESFFREMRDLT
jgi:hypothetical protein